MILPFMAKGKIWVRGVVLGYWRKGVIFHKDGTISSILDYFVNIYVDNCSVSLWTGKSYSVYCMCDLIQTMFGRKRFVKQLGILFPLGFESICFSLFGLSGSFFFFLANEKQDWIFRIRFLDFSWYENEICKYVCQQCEIIVRINHWQKLTNSYEFWFVWHLILWFF